MTCTSKCDRSGRVAAANQMRTGRTLTNTEEDALRDRVDCDRAVIPQARNLEEHPGLRTHTV